MRRAWAEVELAAIRANVAVLRQHLGAGISVMAIVKAGAYGHGAIGVAKAALTAGASWLGVAAVAEGITLRDAGIEAPLLLLAPPDPRDAGELLAYKLTPTVGDLSTLRALADAANRMRLAPEIHLEIETGMGRSGALPEQAVALWQEAVASGLRVTGLSTHFADAENPRSTLTVSQRQQFQIAREALESAGARFALVHLSNSAGILHFGGAGGNLVRAGLLLYGIVPDLPPVSSPDSRFAGERGEVRMRVFPSPDSLLREGRGEGASLSLPLPDVGEGWGEGLLPLSREERANQERGSGGEVKPALALKTVIASVRELPAGHSVSYGGTYRLTRPSRVATALIGYGDGYPRRLSNIGEMLIGGRRAKIRGRVCMDQTVVDVTDIPDAAPGDEAVCIGAQGTERITVEEIARLLETTEHEITTCLTSRVERRLLP